MEDRNNAASTATTTTESVAATASMRPAPRRLPHIMPPRLQPFVPHQLVYSSLTAFCTHPNSPHLSHDYRPPPTRCCSHPIPGFHTRPPHADTPVTTTVQHRSPITALNPLRPVGPAFVCWYSLIQLHTARPRFRQGSTQRHPCLRYNIFWVIGHLVPTQRRLMSASFDAPSAVICLFSSLKFRPTSAADAVVQTTTESNQSPRRDRRLSTPLPLRTIYLKFPPTPAATTVVKTATEPPINFIAAFPYTPQAPAPTTREPTA